jgi:fructokinase
MQIGIDLGGTKIEAIGLEADRLPAVRRRVATPRNYAGAIDAITDLVAEIEREARRPGSVGVGIPGVVSHATGLVKNANSTWLNGKPLLADLETRLSPGRCAWPTMPTASASRRRSTVPAGGTRRCSG